MNNNYYNWSDLKQFGNLSDFQKNLGAKFFAWDGETFKESELTDRKKSLIALAVAHAVQCPYCIDAYGSDAFGKAGGRDRWWKPYMVRGVQMMNKVNEIAM